MSLAYSICSSLLFSFVIANYPPGELIKVFRCSDPYPSLNGWIFGGNHFSAHTTRETANCPLPDGAPCYGIVNDPTAAGYAQNTFNTYGYYDIWISIDVHSVAFEPGDQAFLMVGDGAIYYPVLIADNTIFSGSVITEILPTPMNNNPDCRFSIQFNVADQTNYDDFFYFSNIKIYGIKIPTNAPTSMTKSPTSSTFSPSLFPTTPPTVPPSSQPTPSPSPAPSPSPSGIPIAAPTLSPSSFHPTYAPTLSPSMSPVASPTFNPTVYPTQIPTFLPSISPSKLPTHFASIKPTTATNINLQVVGSLETTDIKYVDNEVVINDIATTNGDLFIGREEEGDTYYFLIIVLVIIIATTLISVLIGLCYFCRMGTKPKQQRISTMDHLDSPDMNLKESPQLQSIEMESHENEQIQMMIISSPTPPSNDPKMVGAYSSMDVDAIDLNKFKVMAPSVSQMEGRVKKMSMSDLLYDDEPPLDQAVGTTTGGTDHGAEELLLKKECIALEEDKDNDDEDDGVYEPAGVSPSDANTLDPSYALPETTQAILTMVIADVHEENLIKSFPCTDPSPHLNGWTFGGTYFSHTSMQTSPNCPQPNGAPCYSIISDPDAPGYAQNTFSTVGYENIWVSIDVNSVQFEFADEAWLSFTGSSAYKAIRVGDDAGYSGSFVTPTLPSWMDNNPNVLLALQIGAGDGVDYKDYFYFSHIKVYGYRIPTNAPTSISNAPTTSTEMPTSVPTQSPSSVPTQFPSISTHVPTMYPTVLPTVIPTVIPTDVPSWLPSDSPTDVSTQSPSMRPTNDASNEDIIEEFIDIETTNDDGLVGREEEGDAFYFLIIALIVIIAATFISVLIGLCYFCHLGSKSKQQRVGSEDHSENPPDINNEDINLKASPYSESIQVESHENEQIRMVNLSPSISPPPSNQPQMTDAHSSVDVDAIDLNKFKVMAPSVSQMEGRVKRKSLSDLLYGNELPEDQIAGTTTGGTEDGVDELLLQKETETECANDGDDDGVYEPAAATPSDAKTLDEMDALPETTQGDKDHK